jgi:hypothetical protein
MGGLLGRLDARSATDSIVAHPFPTDQLPYTATTITINMIINRITQVYQHYSVPTALAELIDEIIE